MWLLHSVVLATVVCYQLAECSTGCGYGGCKYNFDQSYYPGPTTGGQYGQYQYQNQYQKQLFLPAPPGKIPRCAKPGLTFCEKIDRYPGYAHMLSLYRDLIHALVTKTSYNFRSLFADETNEGFSLKRGMIPGPFQAGGHGYGNNNNFNQQQQQQQQQQPLQPNNGFQGGGTGAGAGAGTGTGGSQYPSNYQYYNNFNNGFNNFSRSQSSQQGGYPDRQYTLQEDATQIVDPVLYASFPQPSIDLTDSFNAAAKWWKRSEEEDSQTQEQQHRQVRRQAAGGPSGASGTELCPTRSQFIMPRAALNSRGEWKYVVNVEQGNEKYTQLVRSETCLSTECNGICSVPNGYASRCEQKYVQKRLVALEGSGNQLYTDIFWFPHCCICQISPDIR